MTNSIRARLRRLPLNASDYQCSRLQVTAPGCVLDNGVAPQDRDESPGGSIGADGRGKAIGRWAFYSGYRVGYKEACALAKTTSHVAADVAAEVCESDEIPEWISYKLACAQADLTDVHEFYKGNKK